MATEQMDLPHHLEHRPVFAVPYVAHDGDYAGDTDAQFLSIGWAQYAPRELSAKVIRHSGNRWSRQSEELPLHRVIDLVALLAICFRDPRSEKVRVPAGFFENQVSDLLLIEQERNAEDREAFERLLRTQHGGLVRRRLGALADVLIELREQGVV